MCENKFEYDTVLKKIKIEKWEDNEYIVKYDGNDLGLTVSKEKADFLKKWLPTAFLDLYLIMK